MQVHRRYHASFVGWSGTGKTTIVSSLVRLLSRKGAQVAALKKTNHHLKGDREGSDTELFYRSGSREVALIGADTTTVRYYHGLEAREIREMFPSADYILSEGFFLPGEPCIEVIGKKSEEEGPKRYPQDISAYVVSFGVKAPPFVNEAKKPVFSSEKPEEILTFLEELWNAR